MLTVFAVIGVISIILVIIYALDNSKNNHQASTYLKNHSQLTIDSPQIKLCASIIAKTHRIIQNDPSLKVMQGTTLRQKRLQFLLDNCLVGCLRAKFELANHYNLPVPEVEKHILWSFNELNQKYLLK